jgi:hypothetical protein
MSLNEKANTASTADWLQATQNQDLRISYSPLAIEMLAEGTETSSKLSQAVWAGNGVDPFFSIMPSVAGNKSLVMSLRQDDDDPFIQAVVRDGEVSGYVKHQSRVIQSKKRF